jgi:hypothetical protein
VIEKFRRIQDENQRLRALLTENGINLPVAPPAGAKPQTPPARSMLNTTQKVALFRSLFRGREDVYAQRWESPDGRPATRRRPSETGKCTTRPSPRTENELTRKTRKNIPLTDEAIHAHLAGQQTLGVYPLLLDETCWFPAVDFD